MILSDLFKKKQCVYSFEIFPPKTTSSPDVILNVMRELSLLSPDFISVTYGAGGTDNSIKTLELCSKLKNTYNIEALMHLTCVGSNKDQIEMLLREIKKENISNILALRGDLRDDALPSDFAYASELINFIRAKSDLNTVGACYPEGHVECGSLEKDIDNLKKKVDEGATHLITQLFFDNEDFFEFMNLIRKKGIKVPVQAGVMPIVRANQIDRIISLAGVKIPSRLSRMISKFSSDPNALFEAGIAFGAEQISDLIAGGAQGIHVYVMNKPEVAAAITSGIRTIVGK